VLVAEKIDNLALVKRHALLVGVLKCLLVESVSVLHVVVRLFRLLGKLSLECFGDDVVINRLEVLLAGDGAGAGLVGDFMEKSSLFVLCEASKDWHESLEGFFACLELLVLGLSSEVEHFD
jgi:hypothetical protein